MLYFLIFISGIVFCLIGLPLIDGISSLIGSIFNFLISLFNFLSGHVNAKILKLQKELGHDDGSGCSTNVIGFQSYSQNDYYDDEEEYDE